MADPELDQKIKDLIHSGGDSTIILDKTAAKYVNEKHPHIHNKFAHVQEYHLLGYYHSVLIEAIHAQRLDLIQTILDQRITLKDTNVYFGERLQSPIWEVICVKNDRILDFLIRKDMDLLKLAGIRFQGKKITASPLQALVWTEQFDILLKLLKVHWSNPKNEIFYCLHEACERSSPEFITKLLMVDNIVKAQINYVHPMKKSVLHVAVQSNPDIIPLLLEAGAHPEQYSTLKSALDELCYLISSGQLRNSKHGAIYLVQCLINAGAKITRLTLQKLCRKPVRVEDQLDPDGTLGEYGQVVAFVSSQVDADDKAFVIISNMIFKDASYILDIKGIRTYRYILRSLDSFLQMQSKQAKVLYMKIKLLQHHNKENQHDTTLGRFRGQYCKNLLVMLHAANEAHQASFLDKYFLKMYSILLQMMYLVFAEFKGNFQIHRSFDEGPLIQMIVSRHALYIPFLEMYLNNCNDPADKVIMSNLLDKLDAQNLPDHKTEKFRTWLQERLKPVYSMKLLAKRCIMYRIGYMKRIQDVERLPIPDTLQGYLLE